MTNDAHPIVRNRLFSGRILTAADLELEQQYLINKRRLHNRELHGFGVVSGLEASGRAGKIQVSAGLALDCLGNEIVVPSAVCIDPPPGGDERVTKFLALSYLERDISPVPTTGESENSLIQELFEFMVRTSNENRDHRHARGKWQACGTAHPITIAVLRFSSGAWRIDRRYRPPKVK
jgi:hypothetical protein